MAFSATLKRQNVAGVLRQQIWEWNAAGVTSGTIKTGLSQIDHISFNNQVTENDGKAVASGSDINITSVTSNDTGTISVWGI